MIKFTCFSYVLYFPFPYGYLYANSHRFNSPSGLVEAPILLLITSFPRNPLLEMSMLEEE